MINGNEILITGGSGTLGKQLVKLLKTNYKPRGIRIYSRDELKQWEFKNELTSLGLDNNVAFLLGDVSNYDRMHRALDGVHTVINCAALKQVPACEDNPSEALKTNIQGAENIVQACIDRQVKNAIHISTDKACLDYFSRVVTDKGNIPISTIVNNKMKLKVKTFDGEKFIWKSIINWYKNKLQDRELYKISYKNATCIKGNKNGLIATEDHLISTPNGYKKSKDLKNGELVHTGESKPSEEQMRLVVGSLLGDSCLVHKKRAKNDNRKILSERPYMNFGHAENQLDWLKLKYSALKGIKRTPIRVQKNKDIRHQDFYSFKISCCGFLNDIYNLFYRNEKRILPKKLLKEYFSPLLMASWIMDDDGCSSDDLIRLGTHGYHKNDVYWIKDFLTEEGFECSCNKCIVDNKEYYEIRFTRLGSDKLTKYIGAYILPQFRYKLSNKIDIPNYNKSLWKIQEATSYTDKVIVNKINKKIKRDVYCIDVEDTHNFIANNILVHNCYPVNLYGATKAVAEKLFIAGNVYNRTKFSCCRYGNVLGSRGSIVPLFRKQAETGTITITDKRMTRFWITIKEVSQFIINRIQEMEGGEIFVPRMPSMKIMDMADFIAPGCQIEETGIRPGEKLHECLVTYEESRHMKKDLDKFTIYQPRIYDSPKMERWAYYSDTNDKWLDTETLKSMLGEV